jgi:hypothetical protein
MGLATKYASLPGVGSMYGQLAQHFLTQDDVPASYKEYQIAKQENPKDPSVQSYAAWQTKGQSDKLADAQAKWDDLQKNWQKYKLPDPNSTDPADKQTWRDISEKTFGVAPSKPLIDMGQNKGNEQAIKDISTSASAINNGVIPTLNNLSQADAALKSGVFTGAGADVKLQVARVLQGIGLGPQPGTAGGDIITNTQEFLRAATNDYAMRAHALFPQRTTNTDLNVSKMMAGLDNSQTMDALQDAIQVQRESAKAQIDRHNALVDRYVKAFPTDANVGDVYRVDTTGLNFGATRVTTPEEARKLPPGTAIILPDGRRGTVPQPGQGVQVQ